MHKQTAKFVGVVAQNLPDMSDDLMQGWIENPKALQKVLKNVLCPPEKNVYWVVVDYAQTLDQMIEAGKYNGLSYGITSDHFPVIGTGKKEVEIKLFHFNRTIFSNKVIIEMEKIGYRPASIEELLALGATEKELQKQFPIVALGSVWRNLRGFCFVSYIDRCDSRRVLARRWIEDIWREKDCFAAVRK